MDELEIYRQADEVEMKRKEETVRFRKNKEALELARDYAAGLIIADTDTIVLGAQVMKMALQSEDEGIRLKALGMLLDRLVPRVKAVGGEEDTEVVNIPESRKTLLADIEEEIRKGRAVQ